MMDTYIQAERYRNLSKIQERGGSYLIDKAPLTPGKVVLDLGCGPGNLTVRLAEKVAPQGRVVGVDPDAERIKVAQEKYGGETNVTFVVGSDAEFPGRRAETYDIVYSNIVFHWIKDKQEAFKAIYDSLKPRGTLVFSVPLKTPDTLKALFKAVNNEMAVRLVSNIHIPPSSVYKTLCVEAGFKIVSHEETPFVTHFKSVEDLCEWWKATNHGQFDVTLLKPDDLAKISFRTDDDGQIVHEALYGIFVLVKEMS